MVVVVLLALALAHVACGLLHVIYCPVRIDLQCYYCWS
jgi:hypothetical protein